jgi:hypothetical protein
MLKSPNALKMEINVLVGVGRVVRGERGWWEGEESWRFIVLEEKFSSFYGIWWKICEGS